MRSKLFLVKKSKRWQHTINNRAMKGEGENEIRRKRKKEKRWNLKGWLFNAPITTTVKSKAALLKSGLPMMSFLGIKKGNEVETHSP
jgi:hypothetical protein